MSYSVPKPEGKAPRAEGHYNAHGLTSLDPTHHWLDKFKKDAYYLATCKMMHKLK